MRAASRTLAFLVGLLLAGCMTPPKVSPVERPVDTRTDLGLSPVPAPVQDDWWVAYQDPQLDRLLNAALADNPTFGQALARLHQAQSVVDATRAELSPYISYDFATARERISGKDAVPAPYQGADAWRSRQELNFSWELDFWGRQSSLVRQARSEANATALDEAAARLAIVSAVVRTYIELERSYELVDVARREEQQRQQILDITRHRLNAGLDTNVELKQAAGAVPQARVERLSYEAAIDRDVHLLAAVSGHGADKYGEIQRPKLHTDTVLSVPNALPMDLLARRPDVVAARFRVSSSQAGLDAARADFYPNIDLLAFAGTVAVGPFDNLFHGHAASYGVGPALHLPVLTTETQVLDARRQRVDLEALRASARVTLLIDLGGDFRPDSPAIAEAAGR